MDDAYFIVVTVIFGIFVLAMIVFIYWSFKPVSFKNLDADKLTESEKSKLYKFCGEFRRQRQERKLTSTLEKTRVEKPTFDD
jgi:hypothetical protein